LTLVYQTWNFHGVLAPLHALDQIPLDISPPPAQKPTTLLPPAEEVRQALLRRLSEPRKPLDYSQLPVALRAIQSGEFSPAGPVEQQSRDIWRELQILGDSAIAPAPGLRAQQVQASAEPAHAPDSAPAGPPAAAEPASPKLDALLKSWDDDRVPQKLELAVL